ncbi:uncharacterized protein [Leptinotarsa decemlineata]|uniref:uncharacterized protein n=1 Tax=Leptinotarsa decemlineata TaxID=7539 RepID=UPI000C251DAB|nr:uncharacterized protein LOC111517721 [Leptinotarsa decemlineata]
MATSPVILFFIICISSMYCLADDYVIIQSKTSGMVLDGNHYYVRARLADGSIGQKWNLTSTKIGRFIITNARNGHVLDVQHGCKLGNTSNVIVYKNHFGRNQEFYINSDGTIVSSCDNNEIIEMKDGKVEVCGKEEPCSSGDVFFKILETK